MEAGLRGLQKRRRYSFRTGSDIELLYGLRRSWQFAVPPTITLEQMKGFSFFMLKAVLSGRGDEIVDLARINLFGNSRKIESRSRRKIGLPAKGRHTYLRARQNANQILFQFSLHNSAASTNEFAGTSR